MSETQTSLKYKNRKIYKPPPQQDYSGNFRKLIIVIIISFIFISGQFVGGYISGSISVISDAFHLVTDLMGFVVSFIFIWFSRKKPTEIMTFGYHRMELLGALGNLFIIWALAIFLIYEATMRIINKEFVKEPKVMLIVAAIGLPINIVMYFVLHGGQSHSHGLMSESCGEQFHPEEKNENENTCQQLMCEDIDCLINNQYLQHCHKQSKGQIHKHKNKVQVEGNRIIRSNSIQLKQVKEKHDHKNCNGHHDHQGHNHEGHNHDHEHNHNHNHEHDHNCDHNHEGHNHNHGQRSQSADNRVANSETHMLQNTKTNLHQHNGKSCDHDHDHKHEGHNHDHDHEGHDHHGHDHSHDHHDHGAHHHESMSMKAAVLHALSDVIQSIGLLISSLIIFFCGTHLGAEVTEWNDWHLFDPISTYIFSLIVIASTWPITKNCYHIIMESTPGHLNHKQMTDAISAIAGVVDLHDLHIWDLRPGKTILIAHVFAQTGSQRKVLKKLTDLCRRKRIYHTTFQIEEVDYKDHHEYILCEHDIH